MPTTGKPNDSNGYCVASLGLGNTARAEILEGDVWGALKPGQPRAEAMILYPPAWPLWGS